MSICRSGSNDYRQPNMGAVLLAAGAGARLGGRPKPLLELDGMPLILRQLDALLGAGVAEVVVVLGHHAAAIKPVLAQRCARFVCNDAPDEDQAGSMHLGLQALPRGLDAVIVALADQALIEAQDISALIDAFSAFSFIQRATKPMLAPRVRAADGQRTPGNPVIIDAALREQWLAAGPKLSGRNWRLAHPDQVHWLETDNQHYCLDIDTPEDLLRFEQITGRRLQWPGSPR